MQVKKDTFTSASTETKLNFLYDILEDIHKCCRGGNGKGLVTEVAVIKVRVALLTALFFTVVGWVKWG